MESDLSYFRRRASEEKVAASHAQHPQARRAHIEMAGRYEDLLHALAAREQHLELGVSA